MTAQKTQETTAEPKARLLSLNRLLNEWDAEAALLHAAHESGQQRGAVTGIARLDAEISGALAPGIHILHGSPGSGKTAFGLQTAATCGCPALIVTCEMSPIELLRRITARVTGTYLGRFKTGELSPEESGRLVREAVATVPHIALLDATQVAVSVERIAQAAAKVKLLDPTSKHLLIIVDSLHSWADGAAPSMNEYERLNTAIDALRRVSQHLQCPMLCIAERNRAAMTSGGLSAGAGTRKIEYGAETVIDLEAEKDRTEDAHGNVQVVLTLAKNRHGTPGKRINLAFHGATQSFKEA